MRLTPLVLIAILLSCTKNSDVLQEATPTKSKDGPESCHFGQQVFHASRRVPLPPGKRRPPKGSTPTPAPAGPVILLDFDGHFVTQTSWNVNGDFQCLPANLTTEEAAAIQNRVTEDYSPFQVTITTDEAVYNAADPYKRMRVIITETWEWFGKAGGTSYLNSFSWGDNTPCFVFSSLLGYEVKKIGEAASHEAGHTLGLRHQALYTDCVYTSEYHSGQGTGETSWAPIMGNSYYRNLTTWANGPNPYGCTALQDDLSVLGGMLGFKADGHGNVLSSATPLSTTTTGMINSGTDADFFIYRAAARATISVVPFNHTSHEGANMDIQLKVYNNAGVLLQAINDPLLITATLALDPGTYYLQVEATDNAYTTRYGMLGRYSININ
jgi:hypothetical protein